MIGKAGHRFPRCPVSVRAIPTSRLLACEQVPANELLKLGGELIRSEHGRVHGQRASDEPHERSRKNGSAEFRIDVRAKSRCGKFVLDKRADGHFKHLGVLDFDRPDGRMDRGNFSQQ